MADALRPVAEARGAAIVVVDVDAPGNEALEAEWGERVPALFAGPPAEGALLCHYRLERAVVERALAGAGRGRAQGENPL
jgi:hypothetical protein